MCSVALVQVIYDDCALTILNLYLEVAIQLNGSMVLYTYTLYKIGRPGLEQWFHSDS